MTNKYKPKHKIVAALLRKEIVDGTWQVGDLIPKEADLCQIHNTSRTTVREALSNLENEGLITRSPGRGTQVADFQSSHDSWKLKSVISDYAFTQDLRSEILNVETIIPSTSDFLFHAFQYVTDISRIRILRKIKDTPFALVESHISSEYVETVLEKFDSENNAFVYKILEQITGKPVFQIQDVIDVTLATGEVAKRLEVMDGAPLFYMKRILTDAEGTVLLFSKVHLRPDIQKMSIVIERK